METSARGVAESFLESQLHMHEGAICVHPASDIIMRISYLRGLAYEIAMQSLPLVVLLRFLIKWNR